MMLNQWEPRLSVWVIIISIMHMCIIIVTLISCLPSCWFYEEHVFYKVLKMVIIVICPYCIFSKLCVSRYQSTATTSEGFGRLLAGMIDDANACLLNSVDSIGISVRNIVGVMLVFQTYAHPMVLLVIMQMI